MPCRVEIEHTPESLHAHVELEGVSPEPGDEVIVHGAPTSIPFGEKITVQCRASLVRASPLQRFMAHYEGYLELTELFEVSFSPGRAS